jgi:glycolate oxidase FAD binding subunit
MGDTLRQLLDAVEGAVADGRQLYVRGGDSKRHLLGRACDADELDVSGHRGIVDYQPAELYITARAGTPLAEIEAVLQEQGQQLPFEPALLEGRATLGGALACNLSGPARPWSGSIRDLAMGVQLINGRAECLRFGGRVIKNVAGYDVTRLQAGALGTLGVITEVTVKVLPRPEQRLTLGFDMGPAEALAAMNRRCGEPSPLSGACWLNDRLYLRLSGAGTAVEHTAAAWGGERLPGDEPIWGRLRELALPLFDCREPLWRWSVGSAAPLEQLPAPALIDWAGAQRWSRGAQAAEELEAAAARTGGHACLFCGGDRRGEVRSAPGSTERQLQQRLKRAFDPHGLFNPGRLYGWL